MQNGGILTSWPIRKKLLILLLFSFLPAFGIAIALGLDHRRNEIEGAKKDMSLLAQSLAAQQEQITIGTKQMLSTLALLPVVQSLDVDACNALFREVHKQHTFYSNIALVTPDGNMIAASKPFIPGSVNLSDRKHIVDTIRTREFSPGEYVVGRTNNLLAIYFGYPVLDADKNLIAIVSAGFNLDEYAGFINKAKLPQDSAVIICDYKGVRLYRWPVDESNPIGKPLRLGLPNISDFDDGTFERASYDGIYRIYAFKCLRIHESSPPYIYMIVGISKDKLLQEANTEILYHLLILGFCACIAMLLTWFFGNSVFVKPIDHLVTATKNLGGGDLCTRTGLPHAADEVGQLARSFDDMATLLEMRYIEGKRAEEALRKSEAELRVLSTRLLMAQEEERKRLASELHDSIGQTLAALKYHVEAVLYSKDHGGMEEAMKLLERLVPTLQRSIDETRSIYTGLRPKLLEEMGLVATLKWHCREWNNLYPKHHIEPDLRVEEQDIPEPLKITIFRIAQEALNNVAKHSKAEWVDLILQKNGHGLELAIADDGIGMERADVPRSDATSSLGLTSMKERAELSGGVFSVESTPGVGTTVCASWPTLG